MGSMLKRSSDIWPNGQTETDVLIYSRLLKDRTCMSKGKKEHVDFRVCAACCFQSHGDFWEVGFFRVVQVRLFGSGGGSACFEVGRFICTFLLDSCSIYIS